MDPAIATACHGRWPACQAVYLAVAGANILKNLILFAHGARDPRWAAPFLRLQQLLQADATVTVHLAFLEFMTPSLPDLVAQLQADGQHELTLVPVFLGQGGHVLRDLPPMMAALQLQFPDVVLRQVPAVGEAAPVLAAIANYCLEALSGAPLADPPGQ